MASLGAAGTLAAAVPSSRQHPQTPPSHPRRSLLPLAAALPAPGHSLTLPLQKRLPARPLPRGRTALARRPQTQCSLTPSPEGDSSSMLAAARQLVDDFVRSSMAVGVCGGPGSLMALEHLAAKVKGGSLRDITIVPGSAMMASEVANYGIPMTTLEELKLKQQQLDVAFSDADTVQEGTLYGVIGRRDVTARGSLLREKALARAAKQFVVLVPADQFVEQLQGEVPVEIQQFNWLEVAEEVDDMFIGDAEVWRRPSSGEAGPMGGDFPSVTEGGHFVLDLRFEGIAKPEEVAKDLATVPGVVAHGILINEVHAAAVAYPDGVKIRTSLFRTSFASS